MNDPNAKNLSWRQKGFAKPIKEMLNKKHKFISIKDPRAREAAMYAATATCILGMIAIGTLALKGHSTDEGFSELYFDNPDRLPHVIFVGKGINFSFNLVSYEKTPFTYRFNVTLDGDPVKTGEISLDPQERQKINVTLMPNASSLEYFKTSRVAQVPTELDDPNASVLLNASWTQDAKFSEIEYRYKFMNISVGVSAQKESLTGDLDKHIIADAQHRYEIHFRAITVENIPEKFLNNISG